MAQRSGWPKGGTNVAPALNSSTHNRTGSQSESYSTPLQPFRPEMVSSGTQRPEGEQAAPTAMSRNNPAFLNKLRRYVL